MRRVLLLLLPLLAALAAGGVAVPSAAAAAAPPSITVHVQDSAGAPVADMRVVAWAKGEDVRLGRTDANGDLVASRGRPGALLHSGPHQIFIEDASASRLAAGTTYAPVDKFVQVGPGENDLGTVVVQRAASVHGTLRTPSGAPVAGVIVWVENDDEGTGLESDADGTFAFDGLAPGTYRVYAEGDDADPLMVTLTEGEDAQVDLTVQPQASRVGLVGSTPAPGTEVLVYTISAPEYGIVAPGGTVSVVVDGDRAHPVAVPVGTGKRGGRAVITVDGLTRGTHSFTASYVGGDLTAKRIGITKTVG